MDLNNAIEKGYTMKFEPPYLRFVLGELKAIEELCPDGKEIELSVRAVEGLSGLLSATAENIEQIAEEVGSQIDNAPEPDPEIRKQKQEDEKAPEPAQPSTDSEAGE